MGLAAVRLQGVISSSFADIFYNNCFKNGLLPVILAEEIAAGSRGRRGADRRRRPDGRYAGGVVNFEIERRSSTGCCRARRHRSSPSRAERRSTPSRPRRRRPRTRDDGALTDQSDIWAYRNWDAGTYDRVAGPQEEWGLGVL